MRFRVSGMFLWLSTPRDSLLLLPAAAGALAATVLLLIILHYLNDPKLWDLWYIVLWEMQGLYHQPYWNICLPLLYWQTSKSRGAPFCELLDVGRRCLTAGIWLHDASAFPRRRCVHAAQATA